MDKKRFIELAPYYYALAIMHHLDTNYGKPGSRSSVEAQFSYRGPDDHDPDEVRCYLSHEVLFHRAVAWLVSEGMMEVLADEFGPSLFQRAADIETKRDSLLKDQTLPFYRHSQAPDPLRWLQEALVTIGTTYNRLAIKPEDFDAVTDDEWKPLPLDRKDPDLKQAIAKIDETVELVRGDNGYAATVPGEHATVLRELSDAAETLKIADAVAVPYIKSHVLAPLKRIMLRFKDGALAAVAQGAREAIVTWLKTRGVRILDDFLGLLS